LGSDRIAFRVTHKVRLPLKREGKNKRREVSFAPVKLSCDELNLRQFEIYRDLGFNFDWFAIEIVGFVFPLPDGVRRSTAQ
jgi:hypothetical protein